MQQNKDTQLTENEKICFVNAVISCDYSTMTALLQKGANINYRYKYSRSIIGINETPLTYSLGIGDPALTEFLLKNNADIEAFKVEGFYKGITPLSLACFHHNVSMVELLLRYGANPNNIYSKPLYWICAGMKEELLEEHTKSASDMLEILLDNKCSEDPRLFFEEQKRCGASQQTLSVFMGLWREKNYGFNHYKNKVSFFFNRDDSEGDSISNDYVIVDNEETAALQNH